MEFVNPIEEFGYIGWAQYNTFRTYLKLPAVYLKAVFMNCRDLTEVPPVLPELVEKINEIIWSRMTDKERKEQLYKVRGVPAPYIRSSEIPTAGPRIMETYSHVKESVKKFSAEPVILHFHSEMENGALLACSEVVKSGLDQGVLAKMVDFGALLKEVKKWDDSSELIKSVDNVELLALYMVGKEYQTEFTAAVLESLLARRRLSGRATILSSHLAPAEFEKRYKFNPQAVPMKFEDTSMTTTLSALKKLLNN